jgi:hypothetical protein
MDYDIDNKDEFLNAIKDNSVKNAIKSLLDNTTYISIERFKEQLKQCMVSIEELQQSPQQPIYVYIDTYHEDFVYKSNRWMLNLIKEFDQNRQYKYIYNLDGLQDGDIVLLLDDCIYSGIQMGRTVDDMFSDKKLDIILFVPFMSKEGIKYIDIIFHRTLQLESCKLHIVKNYYEILPAHKYISTKQAFAIAKYYPQISRQHVLNAYPIYFEHKTAKYVSSFPYIYNGILPNEHNKILIIGIMKLYYDIEMLEEKKITQTIHSEIIQNKSKIEALYNKLQIIPLITKCKDSKIDIYESYCPVPPYKKKTSITKRRSKHIYKKLSEEIITPLMVSMSSSFIPSAQNTRITKEIPIKSFVGKQVHKSKYIPKLSTIQSMSPSDSISTQMSPVQTNSNDSTKHTILNKRMDIFTHVQMILEHMPENHEYCLTPSYNQGQTLYNINNTIILYGSPIISDDSKMMFKTHLIDNLGNHIKYPIATKIKYVTQDDENHIMISTRLSNTDIKSPHILLTYKTFVCNNAITNEPVKNKKIVYNTLTHYITEFKAPTKKLIYDTGTTSKQYENKNITRTRTSKQSKYRMDVENSKYYIILSELADGDFQELYLDERNLKKQSVMLNLLCQCILAIASLHKKGYVHNNCNWNNLLYFKTDNKDKYIKYFLNNNQYYLQNIGYIIAIEDFTKAEKYDIGKSMKDYSDILSIFIMNKGRDLRENTTLGSTDYDSISYKIADKMYSFFNDEYYKKQRVAFKTEDDIIKLWVTIFSSGPYATFLKELPVGKAVINEDAYIL